jgi:hypothetical protein
MANTGHMDDDQSPLFSTRGSTLRLNEGADEAPDDAEAKMRQALGLFGTRPGGGGERTHHEGGHGGGHGSGSDRRGGGPTGAAARRHRFVQDGEVPVSVVRARPGARPGADNERAAEELAHERQLRAETERRLADKEVQLRTLQTRIGHAELERDNALAEAREWREKAEAAGEEIRHLSAGGDPAARRAPRRRVEGQLELVDPEPVKWWL